MTLGNITSLKFIIDLITIIVLCEEFRKKILEIFITATFEGERGVFHSYKDFFRHCHLENKNISSNNELNLRDS